jgi:acetyl esterase/lipase
MSADYRLMPPVTGHDIIDDIKDIFRFISGELNSKLSASAAADETLARFGVDPNAIAVAGSSAGGQATYWSAMYVSPKPKAIVLLYAMGGDYLVRTYNTIYSLDAHNALSDSTISGEEDSSILQRSRDP